MHYLAGWIGTVEGTVVESRKRISSVWEVGTNWPSWSLEGGREPCGWTTGERAIRNE